MREYGDLSGFSSGLSGTYCSAVTALARLKKSEVTFTSDTKAASFAGMSVVKKADGAIRETVKKFLELEFTIKC